MRLPGIEQPVAHWTRTPSMLGGWDMPVSLKVMGRGARDLLSAGRAAGRPARCRPGADARARRRQRVEHAAVLLGGTHLALAQQHAQVVDVPSERGQLGARCGQGRDAVGAAAGAARQRWHAGQQAREEGTARQAGPPRAGGELIRLRRLSDGLTTSPTEPPQPLDAPKPRTRPGIGKPQLALHGAPDDCRHADPLPARATSAPFRPRMSTVTKS